MSNNKEKTERDQAKEVAEIVLNEILIKYDEQKDKPKSK